MEVKPKTQVLSSFYCHNLHGSIQPESSNIKVQTTGDLNQNKVHCIHLISKRDHKLLEWDQHNDIDTS